MPNRCGRARSIATSAGQSPPAASITARSQIALPGWCTAWGRANPLSSTLWAWTRPSARAVSVSSGVPALDTDPRVDERYLTFGYDPIVFTLEVPLAAGLLSSRKSNNPSNDRHFRYPRRVSPHNFMKCLG